MARMGTGIDIGRRTSKVLRGHAKGNTFYVTGFALAEHHAPNESAAWAALELPFRPKGARVGLTGREVNVRYTRVPRVPDWQLRNLMRFEVEEIGGQSGSEVASDFNLLPELPEIEGEDVVLLAMARESLLEEHLAGLDSIGASLECFSPCAIGLYNAWTHYGVVEDDTVLVANIGHENIDVVIARGPDLLFARNLSGGSKLLDDALAQRFGVDAAKAEALKIERVTLAPGARFASPHHERASRSVMGAAGQLLSLLQSTVLFCKSQVKISGLKVDRVALCGGGAALEGLCEYLAAGMSVPVELFDPFRVVDTQGLSAEEAARLDEYKLEAVCALGLATMGSDPDAYSLEILPPALARKREFWGGTAWLIGAGLLAAAYLGFSAWHERNALGEVDQQNSGVSAQLRRAVSVHSETEALLEENAALSERALELAGLAGGGEQLARSLEVFAEHLPGDFWLSHLDLGWSYDEELGVPRTLERPILSVKGRAREGTDSPAVLHQGLVEAVARALPAARTNTSLSPTGDAFAIDLTLYAPPDPNAADEDEVGAEGDDEGPLR